MFINSPDECARSGLRAISAQISRDPPRARGRILLLELRRGPRDLTLFRVRAGRAQGRVTEPINRSIGKKTDFLESAWRAPGARARIRASRAVSAR